MKTKKPVRNPYEVKMERLITWQLALGFAAIVLSMVLIFITFKLLFL